MKFQLIFANTFELAENSESVRISIEENFLFSGKHIDRKKKKKEKNRCSKKIEEKKVDVAKNRQKRKK